MALEAFWIRCFITTELGLSCRARALLGSSARLLRFGILKFIDSVSVLTSQNDGKAV